MRAEYLDTYLTNLVVSNNGNLTVSVDEGKDSMEDHKFLTRQVMVCSHGLAPPMECLAKARPVTALVRGLFASIKPCPLFLCIQVNTSLRCLFCLDSF